MSVQLDTFSSVEVDRTLEGSSPTGSSSISLAQAAIHASFATDRSKATVKLADKTTPHIQSVSACACDNPVQKEANKLVETTIAALGGRLEVDKYIIQCDERNGPVEYSSEQIQTLITTYDTIKSASSPLNYQGLLERNKHFKTALISQGFPAEKAILVNTFIPPDELSLATTNVITREVLDKMDLSDGSVIRVLEPGNNDASVPMFMAHQIDTILKYAQEKGLKLNVQVLIMGQGGHATTAVFHQFAEISQSGIFTGIPEAVSLYQTLDGALKQISIEHEVVETFYVNPQGSVQVKLAAASRNTGENVTEAVTAYGAKTGAECDHLLICAARPGATRQALTFAQQFSVDKSQPAAAKLYQSVISIPVPRSAKFIQKGFNDSQAVTEMYAALAEKGRFYCYAYGAKPFIPASVIDEEDLTVLYEAYDRLSGTHDMARSKELTVNEITKFFGDCFTVMEKAIPWDKSGEQQKATQFCMKALKKHFHAGAALT